MPRNFDIGDLMSGKFCDLSKVNGRKLKGGGKLWWKTIRNTLKHRVTGGINTLNQKIATSEYDPS